MTHFDPGFDPAQAYSAEYFIGRRRATARTALVTHIGAVIVLFVFMAGTEGPAAKGSSVNDLLAKVQLSLLAAAVLGQVFLIGRWTQYAMMARQLAPRSQTPRNQWERSAYLSARTGRGAIRVLMAVTVIAAWLAEAGDVPMATYQVADHGYGDPNMDFTIGMFVLFVAVASVAAMTAGFARTGRAREPALPARHARRGRS